MTHWTKRCILLKVLSSLFNQLSNTLSFFPWNWLLEQFLQKNSNNPNFGLNLPAPPPTPKIKGLLVPVVRQCSKLSSYAISKKTNKPSFKKCLKKTNFGPIFGAFGPPLPPPINSFCRFSLHYQLDIVLSCHPMQFKEKLTKQTWENAQKTNVGPDFGLFGSNLGLQIFLLQVLSPLKVRHSSKLSSCAI